MSEVAQGEGTVEFAVGEQFAVEDLKGWYLKERDVLEKLTAFPVLQKLAVARMKLAIIKSLEMPEFFKESITHSPKVEWERRRREKWGRRIEHKIEQLERERDEVLDRHEHARHDFEEQYALVQGIERELERLGIVPCKNSEGQIQFRRAVR